MTAPSPDGLRHSHENLVPKPMLIGIGVLIVTVVLFTAVSRLTGFATATVAEFEAEQTLMLNFTDEEDGAIGVFLAETGERLHTYPPETGGFVRTAMRALALDRRKLGVGQVPPVELVRTTENTFVLRDPATGKRVTLDAFGDDNEGQFTLLFERAGGA